MSHPDNTNNGLITKIWGPSAWQTLHSISFGYPINPSDEHKAKYKLFFELLGDVLPCSYCRDSYKHFITSGDSILDSHALTNRKTLTKWLYRLHNAVNNKLDINYGITYKDIVNRYESYRAVCSKSHNLTKEKGCLMPLNKKAQSYKIANIKDCPLIEYEIATKFIKYAEMRNIGDSHIYLLHHIKQKNILNKCLQNKINDDIWCTRNVECHNIISDMRINGINSIEDSGPFIGLPTINETYLILRLSSNLSNEALVDLIPKLPYNVIYTLSSSHKI